MAVELRAVLDVNVVVSALLLADSVPRRIFDHVVNRGRLLLSIPVLIELDEVLRRPKFDRHLSEELRLEFLAALVREAELVEPTCDLHVCRDPNDDKFLNLAVSGRATHIISGDADLLVIHPFQGIVILSPIEFLQRHADSPTSG